MKKQLFLAVILLSLLAVSCTHEAEEYVPAADTDSVKYAVKQARNNVLWTIPLEPDALSSEPAGKVKELFYPSAGFSGMKNDASVYPELEDFGSIDTSSMSREILSGIHDFLKGISNKTLTFGSSFFDRPYEGVVILYEASLLPAIQGWTVGKPSEAGYGSSSSYEVPVRLETEEGFCTIKIYLNPEKVAGNEVSVQQVMFGAVKSGQ